MVYKNNHPIWSMNYYGRVIGEHFNGDFLKESLKHVSIEMPYRGPESYTKGEYCYHNKAEGNIECFHGYEAIYYLDIKVYECYFHGGKIE